MLRRRAATRVLAAGTVAMVVVSELQFWRKAATSDRVPAEGRGAIVVLGVPGGNAGLRAVQRWRVELAMRAWRTYGCDRVVFTGGAVRTVTTEASDMAAIARGHGLPEHVIVLEERSRTTWENVEHASALLGEVDWVVLASDALHAARARVYWRRQHGAAAPAIVLEDRYRPLDHLWFRVGSVVVEVIHWATRSRRTAWPSPASAARLDA